LIFKHTYQWIIDKSPHTGEPKTSTIRLHRPYHRMSVLRDGRRAVFAIKNGKPRLWHYDGQIVAVQPGRGKRAIARVQIMNIRWVDVRELAPSDVRREGVLTRDDFLRLLWCQMHDPAALTIDGWEHLEDLVWSRPGPLYQGYLFALRLVKTEDNHD